MINMNAMKFQLTLSPCLALLFWVPQDSSCPFLFPHDWVFLLLIKGLQYLALLSLEPLQLIERWQSKWLLLLIPLARIKPQQLYFLQLWNLQLWPARLGPQYWALLSLEPLQQIERWQSKQLLLPVLPAMIKLQQLFFLQLSKLLLWLARFFQPLFFWRLERVQSFFLYTYRP